MSLSRHHFARRAKNSEISRRAALLGAVAAAACTTTAPPAPQAPADPEADANFRALIERLGGDSVSGAERITALRNVERPKLSAPNHILLDSVLEGAAADAALADFPYAQGPLYIVTARGGTWRAMPTLALPIDPDTSQASRAYVGAVDAETARLQANAAAGVIAPASVLDGAIRAVQTAAGPATEHGAALQRQLAVLQDLRKRTPPGDGIWRLPRGDEAYAHQLSVVLGATTNPQQAHTQALAQCTELQAEADRLLKAQGLSEGDVGARLRTLMQNPRYLYPDSDDGKNAAVTYMNLRLARARELMPHAFAAGLEQTPAQVVRMSASDEALHAAGRRERQSYIVDLSHIRNRPSWTLPSVVHHELLPGHLLQGPLGEAANASRLQYRYAGGYSEGWAIYAERLMVEQGAFADDPLAHIGYLQWMLFRIGRIVADTGVHVMRWDRARAIAELRALQGDSIAFITIEEDVDRIILQPGVYAAQGLAALAIHDVRENVKRRAGSRFSLPRFHDAMLRSGPLSPPGLARAADVAFAL